MDKMPCIPVKITDKQWADKLQDGFVFMRSLHEYGSWSAVSRAQANDQLMKSGVQGDVGEGIVRRVDPKVGDAFFNGFSPEIRAAMESCMYIDEERYQYFKVYCMYGLTYLIDENRYDVPDERLKDFGDTAVIITDPNEFLNRVLQGLYRQFGDNVDFRLDEVCYYPPDYYGNLDEFCKLNDFSWQNEMRMRVALLDGTSERVDQNGLHWKPLIQDINSITVDIGDIRDITMQIPVQDLIDLKLPDSIKNPKF